MGNIDNFKFDYVSIDVYDDFNQLPRLVESFYLSETYHYQSWSEKSNKTYTMPTIVSVYAEVHTEMMKFLEASLPKDIFFTKHYASFNASLKTEQFEVYAFILNYIVTHRLKWERLLILSVQPSEMTPLYGSLIEKAEDSKLCVQYKEVNRSWNITEENYFTAEWFAENKPAVVTIGEDYGQVEIIKQLTDLMKTKQMTISNFSRRLRENHWRSITRAKKFRLFQRS